MSGVVADVVGLDIWQAVGVSALFGFIWVGIFWWLASKHGDPVEVPDSPRIEQTGEGNQAQQNSPGATQEQATTYGTQSPVIQGSPHAQIHMSDKDVDVKRK